MQPKAQGWGAFAPERLQGGWGAEGTISRERVSEGLIPGTKTQSLEACGSAQGCRLRASGVPQVSGWVDSTAPPGDQRNSLLEAGRG